MLNEILQLKRPLVIFDLETTDKDPLKARIVEMGMRIHWPLAKSVSSHKTLINPGIPIPQNAIDAHGITDAMFEDGAACNVCRAPRDSHTAEHEFKPIPTFKQIAPELHRGLASCDFAGYNVRYDLRVITEEFLRCGIAFDYSQAGIIDVLRIWQILEPRTLSDAVEYFLKRKHRGAHGAMEDVEETEAVLISQFTEHPRRVILPRTVAEIHEKCFPNQIDSEGKFVFIDGVACFNFGKLRGQPMSADVNYLQWMRDKGNFSSEVKRIVSAAIGGKFPEPKANEPS